VTIMYGCRLVQAPKKRTACGWCTCDSIQMLGILGSRRDTAEGIGTIERPHQHGTQAVLSSRTSQHAQYMLDAAEPQMATHDRLTGGPMSMSLMPPAAPPLVLPHLGAFDLVTNFFTVP